MSSIRRLILSGVALAAFAGPAIAEAQSSTSTVRDRDHANGDTNRVRRDRNKADGSARSSISRGSRDRSARTPAVMRGLDLSVSQRSRIDALFADYRRDVRALRDSERSSDVKRRDLDTRTQRLHSDIRSVLTPAQRVQFDANVARARDARADDRRDDRRDRFDNRRRDRNGDRDHDDDDDDEDEDGDDDDDDNRRRGNDDDSR